MSGGKTAVPADDPKKTAPRWCAARNASARGVPSTKLVKRNWLPPLK